MERTYKHNNQVIVISTFEVEANLPLTILSPPFNNQLKEAIEAGEAVAGCDALVKDDMMEAY